MISVFLYISLFASFNFEQLNKTLSKQVQGIPSSETRAKTKDVDAKINEKADTKEDTIEEVRSADLASLDTDTTLAKISDQKIDQKEVAKELAFNSQLEIRFTSSPSLHVGDPVLFKGIKVGSVFRVEYNKSEQAHNKNTNKGNTAVSIKLSSDGVPLSDKLVGLVGSVKLQDSKKINSNKLSSRSFLELIKVEAGNSDIKKHDYLLGFNSFQEFWSSGSSFKPVS